MAFQESARWADHTSMGAGSSEFFLAEPATMDELSRLLDFLREKRIGFYPIGDGTNLIGSDRPLDRIVIRLTGEFRSCSISGTEVSAGGGCRLGSMIAAAATAAAFPMREYFPPVRKVSEMRLKSKFISLQILPFA